MKVQANPEGRGKIESGFQRAEDGWHVVKVAEGIDFLKKKDKDGNETIAVNKKGDKLWKIPLVVDDENDESNEIEIDSIIAENAKGEQLLVDYLGATGLFAAFAKAFPGDVSIFEDKCMGKVKVKLAGQYMRVKTKQNAYKDKAGQEQTAVNIVGFGKMADTVEALEAALFPEKKGGDKGAGAGKKESKEKAPEVPDEEF